MILITVNQNNFSIEFIFKKNDNSTVSNQIFINDDFSLTNGSHVYLPFFIKMIKIKNVLSAGIQQSVPLPQVIKKYLPPIREFDIGYQIENVFVSDKSKTEKKSMKKTENFENLLQEFIDELMTQKSLNDIDHLGEVRLVHNDKFDRGLYLKDKLNNITGLTNSIFYNPTKRKFVFNENTNSIFEYIVKSKSS